MFVTATNKLLAKSFVTERLGQHWVTPTFWSGSHLPASRPHVWPNNFVLKASHTSGKNIFAQAPGANSWQVFVGETRAWMREPYLENYGEWWYNEGPRAILAEPFLEFPNNKPIDYKFFVFSGTVQLIQVDTDRASQHKRAFFDRNWQRQPIRLQYPLETRELERPMHLGSMIEGAEILGKAFSFARVDLYSLADGPRFGEITLAPGSGFERFYPRTVDHLLGQMWR